MLWALALEAVRQKHDKTRHAQPFAFTRTDELVEHDLRAVGEIAELRFPKRQRIWLRQRVAVLKPENRIFRQHGVDDFILRLACADVVERVVALFGFLVDQTRVALREGAARAS